MPAPCIRTRPSVLSGVMARSRLEDGYRSLFSRLYAVLAPAAREHAIALHVERARALARREGFAEELALRREYETAHARARGSRSVPDPATLLFACDAGLGGLARWL